MFKQKRQIKTVSAMLKVNSVRTKSTSVENKTNTFLSHLRKRKHCQPQARHQANNVGIAAAGKRIEGGFVGV